MFPQGPGKLPKDPRPAEVGQWFRIGRRGFLRKAIPEIESVKTYEDEWVTWWTAAQPEWRETEHWPFPQCELAEEDWGDLFSSGKDGLFIVVMSLSWWIHARDPAVDSKVDDAISDVFWVLESLIASLSIAVAARDSQLPATPPPRAKRPKSIKIGPPTKRHRKR